VPGAWSSSQGWQATSPGGRPHDEPALADIDGREFQNVAEELAGFARILRVR
jgi:hypothetical protein